MGLGEYSLTPDVVAAGKRRLSCRRGMAISPLAPTDPDLSLPAGSYLGVGVAVGSAVSNVRR